MRTRIALGVLLALATSGCAQALDVLAPQVFYGYASSAQGNVLCLSDARQEDPERERCFEVTQETERPPQLMANDLVKIAYEDTGAQFPRATSITLIRPGQ